MKRYTISYVSLDYVSLASVLPADSARRAHIHANYVGAAEVNLVRLGTILSADEIDALNKQYPEPFLTISTYVDAENFDDLV